MCIKPKTAAERAAERMAARIYQAKARQAHDTAESFLADYQRGDHYEGYAIRAKIEQETAAYFAAKARSAMGLEQSPEEALRDEGWAKGLRSVAEHLRIFASDNDEINRRYGTKGKALEIANKRTQTFNDAATFCEEEASAVEELGDDG